MVYLRLFYHGSEDDYDEIYFDNIDDAVGFYSEKVKKAVEGSNSPAQAVIVHEQRSCVKPARIITVKIKCKDHSVVHSSSLEGHVIYNAMNSYFLADNFQSRPFDQGNVMSGQYLEDGKYFKLDVITALSVVDYMKILMTYVKDFDFIKTEGSGILSVYVLQKMCILPMTSTLVNAEQNAFSNNLNAGSIYHWPSIIDPIYLHADDVMQGGGVDWSVGQNVEDVETEEESEFTGDESEDPGDALPYEPIYASTSFTATGWSVSPEEASEEIF